MSDSNKYHDLYVACKLYENALNTIASYLDEDIREEARDKFSTAWNETINVILVKQMSVARPGKKGDEGPILDLCYIGATKGDGTPRGQLA